MNRLKIGVALRCLGLNLRDGLAEARKLGVPGVELDAAGDLSPSRLSQTGRRELRHLLKSHGVELCALHCPLRHGLDVPDNLQPRIEHVANVLTLSYEMGARRTVVQAGCIPPAADDPRQGLLSEALLALGRHGDRVGATLALDTGLESGDVLRAFLDRLDTGSLGADLDPGNLLMHGFDVPASVRALAGRIVHVHARDARQASTSRAAAEVPLGHGDIDWLAFLALLEEIGYAGWLTVVRDGAVNPGRDVAAGVGFLRRLIG